MVPFLSSILRLPTSPLHFEYLPAWAVVVIFLLLAAPTLLLGRSTIRWQGAGRGWTSIGLRLALYWVLVMMLAGATWQRENKDLQVIVLRDVSDSTANVLSPPGKTLISSLDELVRESAARKRADDRIGMVRFDERAAIEQMPRRDWIGAGGGVMQGCGGGTDIASAIQLGLACFRGDAMKRLVLVSDGNATQGQTEAAIAAASAARVPIDVLPLHYANGHDVVMDELIGPQTLREGEPLTVEVMLRSTSDAVTGRLTIFRDGVPIALDPTPGAPPAARVRLHAGANPFRYKLGPLPAGLNEFRAVFEADNPADDPIRANNSADTFVFARGQGKVLFVDGIAPGGGHDLADALTGGEGHPIKVDRIKPDEFPTRASALQAYDAVVLANVPRGSAGLGDDQDRLLAHYVRDLGGGLLVVGGPNALGAGGWQGSALEKVLPLDMDAPANRVLPAGALVVVLDRSGSMGEGMPGGTGVTKQQVACESTVLALQTMLPDDYVGVIAFDASPEWIVPLGRNDQPAQAAAKVRQIAPAGGTTIPPAIEMAYDALAKLPSEQAAAKRILLLTDGDSDPYNYNDLLERLHAAHITLSTIAVGGDADVTLLRSLARDGGGSAYIANDPSRLTQVFVREARTLRRSLISEPPNGIAVRKGGGDELLSGLDDFQPPPLRGMVLTSAKSDPLVSVPLKAENGYGDPILASWRVGLGRSAVFTADAARQWSAAWVASDRFGAFWRQVVRDVARPAVSTEFDARIVRDGSHGRLIVDAAGQGGSAANFLNFGGNVVGPDARSGGDNVQLHQTGPGRYEAPIEMPAAGSYFAAIQYQSADGKRGTLIAGAAGGASPEFADLQSNDALLSDIAARTGGRELPGLDAGIVDLFSRENLHHDSSPTPLWDLLVMASLGLVIIDVASRRLALDWKTTRQVATAAATKIRQFTLLPTVQSAATLATLRNVRQNSTTRRFEAASSPGLKRPLVQNVSEVVGGAVHKAQPPESPKIELTASQSSGRPTSGLLEAKRRAQEVIRQRADGSHEEVQ